MNMRLFWLSFLLLGLEACTQKKTDAISLNIENAKTNKHINIPGTRLFIIPPPNFSTAKGFIGLQDGKNSILNVMDLVGGNYNTNAATFSKEEFEKKGAKVFDYKEIRVGGFPAKYISMQGDATTKEYALVFGDTTFSTMIIAAYPATDENTGKEIISSLNSICYDKSIKIDPLTTANFSIDDKDSKFKFFKY